MKGIIYYTDKAKGVKKLEEISQSYLRLGIKPTGKNINQSFIQFENDDFWMANGVDDSAKGFKCNIAYVPIELQNSEKFVTIIKPSIIALPFQGINFY